MVESRADRVREAFDAIVDLAPEARRRRLAELREEDSELAERIESLLNAERKGNLLVRALDRLLGGVTSSKRERGTDSKDPYGLVGTAVGPYQVVERLGGGGMGVVYGARDLDLDRSVALKFLPPGAGEDAEALQRFLREARAASALDHPSICTIHAIDRTPSGSIFIVMAFYDGESLRERIARGPIPWREAVEIALQAARGLQRAHEAEIVHRDIKPANVMLTPRGEVKILDFGIARITGEESMTRSGGVLGTAAYMSPEQVRGATVDGRSDIWSLGVVLYEMVAGRRPFAGDHPLVIFHAILREQPAPLAQVGVQAPESLQTILDRALAKERAERYAEAAELIADLESLLAAGPLPTGRTPLHTTAPLPDLPTPLTGFLGREAELEKIGKLLGRSRLVTLTGPAGTGKTRLAIEAAARLTPRFEDGVRFVDLAPLADVDLVASAVAGAVGIEESGVTPLTQQLIDALRERELLLVLDNFDHLVAAAPLVTELLGACPRLRALITSQVALRLSGEQEYHVPPLALPDLDREDLAEVLEQYPATALFVQRATGIDPDLTIEEEDARAIAVICTRLDGLPLAIELAAARTRLLTPRAILERLGRRLDLLTGGTQDRPPRHRTLRQAIGWSYDLLEPAERALHRRLSVFSGGWSLEAAEAVAWAPDAWEEQPAATVGSGPGPARSDADDPSDSGALLDSLEALVSRSLAQRGEGPDGTPRFWMLETIREFGLERLREAGEEERTRRLHAEHFLRLAEEAAPELTGPAQARWTARLAADHDNLRSALDWAEAQEGVESGLRLGAALWRFWAIRGHLREGRQRLERLVSSAGASERTAARAAALSGLGTVTFQTGDYPSARAPLEESLEIYRSLGDRQGIARVLNALGWVAVFASAPDEARSLNEEAEELNRELGDRRGLALALNNLGQLAHFQADYHAARDYHERSLELRRELGDQRGYAFALVNRSWADLQLGRFEEAERGLHEALDVLTRLGERQILGWARFMLANVEMDRGATDSATALFEEAVQTWRNSGNRAGLAWSVLGLAEVTLEAGELDRAEALLGESGELWRATGSRRGRAYVDRTFAWLRRLQEDVPAARRLLREALNAFEEVGDRHGVARCLEELAAQLATTGAWSDVALMMGAAEALREAIASPLPPSRLDEWNALLNRGREEAGADGFESARLHGTGLSTTDAIDLARSHLTSD